MSKIREQKGFQKFFLVLLFAFVFAGIIFFIHTKNARAAVSISTCTSCTWPQFYPIPIGIPPAGSCAIYDCPLARLILSEVFHDAIGEPILTNIIQDRFENMRNWFVGGFFDRYVIRDLILFAQQMSTVGMQQAMIVGMFMDAQHQMETERLLSELKNEAHRDYQPSEDFCWFGTGVRSMASTEARSRYLAQSLNARQIARHMGNVNQSAAASPDDDKKARWDAYTERYCNPDDNGWNGGATGLQGVCQAGSGDDERTNLDIDYTRLIDTPRSLLVNFSATDDRQDIFALGNNLYGHDVLSRDLEPEYFKNENFHGMYLALRSIAARRNVAENSFNAIVELKAAGTSDIIRPAPEESEESRTREFLAAILTEMGVPEGEVYEYIGERPSYYAQLELLAKKIYQNPDFYANLYDKPANVSRKVVALKAIELMLDRAIYESELRQEMVSSVLLSTKLRDDFIDVNEKLGSLK